MTPSSAAARAEAEAGVRSAARVGAPARRPAGPPRRVSGPARSRVASRPAPVVPPFAAHVTRIVDHSLLDRLIRGRTWIGLVAFALIGIVAMQVALLKLNAGIGSSIERATVLQRESSLLTAQVAELASPARIQTEAAKLGMVYPPPADVRYLRASTGDAARAAGAIVAPSSGTTGPSGSAAGANSSSTSAAVSSSSSALLSGSDAGTSSTSTPSTDQTPPAGPADTTGSTSSTDATGSGDATASTPPTDATDVTASTPSSDATDVTASTPSTGSTDAPASTSSTALDGASGSASQGQ
jgi:cell division protein FtsL